MCLRFLRFLLSHVQILLLCECPRNLIHISIFYCHGILCSVQFCSTCFFFFYFFISFFIFLFLYFFFSFFFFISFFIYIVVVIISACCNFLRLGLHGESRLWWTTCVLSLFKKIFSFILKISHSDTIEFFFLQSSWSSSLFFCVVRSMFGKNARTDPQWISVRNF